MNQGRFTKYFLITPLLIVLTQNTLAATVYKWVDDKGEAHYSDKPAVKTSVQQIDTKSSVPLKTQPSTKEKADNVDFKWKKIVVYTTQWCPQCKKARDYFAANNIKYQEYDVENSLKGKQDFKRLKGKGVPFILVDNQRMEGFSSQAFEQLFSNTSTQ